MAEQRPADDLQQVMERVDVNDQAPVGDQLRTRLLQCIPSERSAAYAGAAPGQPPVVGAPPAQPTMAGGVNPGPTSSQGGGDAGACRGRGSISADEVTNAVSITAPVSLTIYLAWLFITFVDERVFSLLPPEYHPETYFRFSIPGIGLLLALVGLTLIGALTAGMIGRALNGLLESILNRLPVIRSLYGAIKQIMETVLANKSAAFRECVLVEYPRKGMWTLGFSSISTWR